MSGSVLFYVQYLLGIGHLQRSLRIAEALVRRGVAVTLVSGGAPVELPRDPAVRFVQLPPIRARDASFALLDERGQPIGDAQRNERRAALLSVFATTRPDAVILEGYPFARRAFRFELEPLIAAVRVARPQPLLLCSLRDIVAVRDDPQRHREIIDRVRRDFDAVLVHGDPGFIALDASFPPAAAIADRLAYTGYVSPPPDLLETNAGAGEVVVSAGGGGAGHRLLATAHAEIRSGCLAGLKWRLVAGGNLPEAAFAELGAAAPAGVVVERFRGDLGALLRRCRVSVSQAGYNTVLDILAGPTRAVLVPFAAGRETEQLVRAERLAALGAVELLRESELDPAVLGAAIERAAAREPAAVAIDTGGAANAAQLIAAMICRRRAAGEFVADTSASIISQ